MQMVPKTWIITAARSRILPSLRRYSRNVIWVQALSCFALWIVYGVFQSKRSDAIRARISRLSRTARAWLGALLMVGGAVIMIAAGLLMESLKGFTPKGMTMTGWLVIAAAGLAFVHAQTMAFAMLVSLAYDSVTNGPRPPSDQRNDKGTNQDEASPDLP
jgi:hypothetical protein